MLGTSDPLIGMDTPSVHLVEKASAMPCWSMLAMAKADTLVERTSEATIVFALEAETMLGSAFETLT